ncbi:MAG: cytochrome c [Bdellovibrionaceae bacterium]|nr:cytochrome c [Pseudobdellovibrionaceae bacterium]
MVSDRSLSVAMMFFVGLFAMVFLMGLTGCTKDPQQTNIEVIQDMMVQPSVKAQDVNPHTGKSGMLVPPEGTAAMNREVYLYKGDPQAAAEKLTNPSGDTAEVLEMGERHFKNYCYVCHGEQGKGDGPVAEKFQGIKPPSLLSDKVRGMKDGQIFHIITDGQGVMGAYINQMPWSKDRWAVVTYVRKLQKDVK